MIKWLVSFAVVLSSLAAFAHDNTKSDESLKLEKYPAPFFVQRATDGRRFKIVASDMVQGEKPPVFGIEGVGDGSKFFPKTDQKTTTFPRPLDPSQE